MSEIWQVVVGAGMVLMEASYIPQLVKLYRMKEAEEFTPWYPFLNLIGRVMAVSYSIYAGQFTLAAGFSLGIIVRAILLYQVLYYKLRHQYWYLKANWIQFGVIMKRVFFKKAGTLTQAAKNYNKYEEMKDDFNASIQRGRREAVKPGV